MGHVSPADDNALCAGGRGGGGVGECLGGTPAPRGASPLDVIVGALMNSFTSENVRGLGVSLATGALLLLADAACG
jgi:hypothetical protein